jgi:hypothetical protein
MLTVLLLSAVMPCPIDMVGEEDFGQPLLYHQYDLSIGMNDAIINQSAAGNGRLPLFLHAGESNWQPRAIYPRGINFCHSLFIRIRFIRHINVIYRCRQTS